MEINMRLIQKIFFFAFLIFYSTNSLGQDTPLRLTTEEYAWLKDHPVIRVHNETDWPPFNFAENGTPKGYSIDFMNLVAKKAGLEVDYITGPTWNDFLGMMKHGDLDVMLNIVKTSERKKYLLFTPHYAINPNTILCRREAGYEKLEQLFGKIVSIPKGFFYEEILTRDYPQITILTVKNTLESMKAVSFGKADAAFGELAVFNYLLGKHMMTELMVAGEVKTEDPELALLNMATRKDLPHLATILTKGIRAITTGEKKALQVRWLGQTEAETPKIDLTSEERSWIQSHPSIKANGGEWPPFIIREKDGETAGISSRILNLAAGMVGLTVEYVDGPWPVMQEMFRNRDLDLLQCLSKTPEREKKFHFTHSYIDLPDAIYTRTSTQGILSVNDLKGKKLAVDNASHLHEKLKTSHPDIRLVPVHSVREGLRMVSVGEVNAYIGPMIVAQYELHKNLIVNLKVAAYFDEVIHDLRLGAHKDNKILADILQKGLDAIPQEQKRKIITQYISMADVAKRQGEEMAPNNQLQENTPQSVVAIGYQRLVIYGLIIFLVVSLLAFILIQILKKENIAVNFGSAWFRGIVLAGLTIFVVTVAFAGWYYLERNKTQILQEVDEKLRGQILMGQDRLNLWLTERLSHMARLGRDPGLVSITKRLLGVEPHRDSLLGSRELKDMRAFFKKEDTDIFSNIGFFIINPNHISIGSMRDGNIGTRNLISKQHPELLLRAYQGDVGFVPPMTSDVNLGNSSSSGNEKKPSTMFFIGPIIDAAGNVLAVMTLRVDPWKDFTRAVHPFGETESIEAYAFDRNGWLLSSSRFDNQLRRIGLLAENQSSALNIQIRDPGGNLIEGYRPKIKRSEQPLTFMAAQALKQMQQVEKSQIQQGQSFVASNIQGYRDYRGVPVFGAWIWSVDLNMGLAVEVDVDEALLYYLQTRRMIFSILGFTLFLSVGAILFVLIIGERTSRALMHARDELEQKVADRTSELQENQERFAALLESAPDAMVVSNETGKIVLVNTQTEQLFGYHRTELLGNPVELLVPENIRTSHPDIRKRFLAHASVRQMGAKGMELQAQDKKGALIPVDITLSPIETASGILVVASIRDITDRKAAETELVRAKEEAESAREQAEERSRELVDLVHGLPIPTALFDPEGDVMALNQAFTSLLGYTMEDIPNVEAHWAPFYPNVDYRAQIKEDWTGRVQNSAETGKPIEPMDLAITSKSNEIYELQAHTVQVGRVAATMWVDFTERKRMEKSISDERERLQQILDTSPVCVAMSVEGSLVMVNPLITKLFGLGPGDSVQHVFVNREDRNRLIQKLQSTKIVRDYELQAFDKNGDTLDFLATYMVTRYEGKKALLTWWINITDLKKAETNLREKFDELSRFRKLAVGREKKMIELKKEVNVQLQERGLAEKYIIR